MQKKIIVFIFFISILISCKDNNKKNDGVRDVFLCNTEVVNNNGELSDYFNNNLTFSGKKLINKQFAFSGKSSLKLTKKRKFAFSFKIPNIKTDNAYKVSVWFKGDAKSLSIVAQGSGFYKKSSVVTREKKKGWQQMVLNFIVPPNYNVNNPIKIYVWNFNKKTIYVDDFKIENLSKEIKHIYKETPLRIYIEDDEINKLKEIRKKAFEKKILETTSDSWVKAVLFYGDETYKAKLRFKGDWLDHLQGIKWSFRIKLKKDGAFKGMREFSIQTPAARYFIDEWLAHKIFEKEDVLTTRYDFIPVYLNGENLGLYVYEEHFVKQLIENKQRREGPVIKFSENQMWKARVFNEDKNYPVFLASEIVPFKISKTIKDEKLKKQFEIAQNLLNRYKLLTNDASAIFDIDKLAKYLALIDITRSYHGLIWHNQRFYYNPVIAKLEPIAYDNYCDAGVMQWTKRSIHGNTNISKIDREPKGYNNFIYLFRDSVFVDKYISYLKEFSSKEYINNIYKLHKKEIKKIEKKLKYEFPNYEYNNSFLQNNAKVVRAELPKFIKNYDEKYRKKYSKPEYIHIKKYNPKYIKDVVPFYVRAWNNSNKIKVVNYYPKDIIILGQSVDKKIISNPIFQDKTMSYFESVDFDLENNDIKYLYFKVKGQKDIFHVNILKYKFPNDFNPTEELKKNITFEGNENFIIKNRDVIFKTGKTVVENSILIPEGYNVIFEKGANIDFINNSMFISYSPIFMNGESENKIIIQSSDGTARGFSVLQAKEKSLLNNVIFNNFNTLEYKGWALSGAINFYESDVEINNTSFKNNLCEDALNIVRSNFKVSNCNFYNIFSDAFDSDFCTGTLSKTEFNKIGNDAIDFSGSKVYISDCNMKYIGDKGVSGGENSKLTVDNCFVSDAQIGFASKDKSVIKLNNCKVVNSKYGLIALQKKPEYDYATIIAKEFQWTNLIELYAIEKKSKLTLNNKKIKGTIKKLAKRFY